MALVKCKECNKEISDVAKQCPSCGYKIKKVGLFWPIIFGLILFGYFFGDEEETSKKVKVKEVKQINQIGRDKLQKQYWDPGYVEAGFWTDKKFVIKIKCEIYPNCPRYIPNIENSELSVHVPREGKDAPPAPEWKERDYIQDILPEDDPHKK